MASELAKRLDRLGQSAVKRLGYSLKLQDGNASGKLEKSMTYRIKSERSKISMSVEMEDYWKYADKGRPAGTPPPLDKIIDWLTYPSVQTKIRGRDDLPSGKEILNLAYAIRGKIGAEGTDGNDFADVILDNKTWDREVEEAIEESIDVELDQLLDEAFLTNNSGLVKVGKRYIYES